MTSLDVHNQRPSPGALPKELPPVAPKPPPLRGQTDTQPGYAGPYDTINPHAYYISGAFVEAVKYLAAGVGIFLFLFLPMRLVFKWSSGAWQDARAPWKRQAVLRSLLPLYTLTVVASRAIAEEASMPQPAIVIPAICVAIAVTVADWRNLRSDLVDLRDDSSRSWFLQRFVKTSALIGIEPDEAGQWYLNARSFLQIAYMNVLFPLFVSAAGSVWFRNNADGYDWFVGLVLALITFGTSAIWTLLALPSVKKYDHI